MKLNKKEALRYLGFRGAPADETTAAIIDELGGAFLEILAPKTIYNRYDIVVLEDGILLDGWEVKSRKLAHHLAGCEAAYLFAATLGLAADMRIRRETAVSPARGAVAHAICNALIESWCDEVQGKIAAAEQEKGLYLRPRFSPGFGDLALEAQRPLFSRLNPEKNIGVTLTDTLLMVPVKSVTALIGVTADETRQYHPDEEI